MSDQAGPVPRPRPVAMRRGRATALAAALLALGLVGGFAWGEWRGWPMLAAPLAQRLTSALGRPVSLEPAADAVASGSDGVFRLQLLGGLRLHLPQLRVAAPAWAGSAPLLLGQDLDLALSYGDLWRAWRGKPLHIQRLQARSLVAHLRREADGRASWLADAPGPDAATSFELPSFGTLTLREGRLHWHDALLGLQVDADAVLALQPAAAAPSGTKASAVASAAASASASASASAANTAASAAASMAASVPRAAPDVSASFSLQAQAHGQYQGRPVQIELRARATPAVAARGGSGSDAAAALHQPMQMVLQATVGRARLSFDGGLDDAYALVGAAGWLGPAGLQGLAGRFTVSGPSLAAVGDPLGVTLPSTHAFTTQGRLRKAGNTWFVVVDDARVGHSRLRGDFTYEKRGERPLLSGRLSGPRLLLADLGPAVGVPTDTPGRPAKRLPDRPFDLAALRSMDANVLIAIDELDLDTPLLTPLKPLHAHLRLQAGLLDIGALDARAGPGRLQGKVQLDGRQAVAALRTDLRFDGLLLEQWIRQSRAAGQPPWVSGRVRGRASLHGRGNSTAALLATLDGRVRADWMGGRMSHLAVEAAGLDLAQALGVLIRGDDALTVTCAVADLVVKQGVFSPRPLVIDTSDSTLWVDGQVSLASEALDLRVIVSPRDFSPLALRTPLRVRGTLAAPQVSVEAGRLAGRLGLAALLALVNPLAGLLPLLDAGDGDAAQRDAAGCSRLLPAAGRAAASTSSR